MLHVHQDMISVANDYVERNDKGKQIFGHFTDRDRCKLYSALNRAEYDKAMLK